LLCIFFGAAVVPQTAAREKDARKGGDAVPLTGGVATRPFSGNGVETRRGVSAARDDGEIFSPQK